MGNKKSLGSTYRTYIHVHVHIHPTMIFVDWNSQNNTGSKECCENVLIRTKAIITYLLHMYCTCKSVQVAYQYNTTTTMLAYESGGAIHTS